MIQALRLNEPERFEWTAIAAPAPPGPGEALVRVLRTGICGTDLHAFRGRQPFFTYPRILGHELAVEVLQLGDGVTQVAVGDRCAIEPFLNCGSCGACSRGKTNCCESLRTLGVHTDGGMCERIVVPAAKLHPSAKLSLEQLATVEPLCIGSHAYWRAQPDKGDSIAVIGVGPIGLAVVAAARADGIEPVVVDISPVRRKLAEDRFGLRAVASAGDLSERPRAIFDCTGNRNSMLATFETIGHGGKIVFVGLVQAEISFHNPNFHAREITLMSSRNATAVDFRRVISQLEDGRIRLDGWHAGLTSPADAPAEFPRWTDPEQGIIKPMLTWV